jgi:hypothetical protein
MRRAYALLSADELPYAVEAAPHLFPDFDESFDRASELILDAIERQAEANRSPSGPSITDDGDGAAP